MGIAAICAGIRLADSVFKMEKQQEYLLPIRELRSKLRTLLREVAHIEEELRWLETDVESAFVARGLDEVFGRLLSHLEDQKKAEMSATTT
jgi:hypothetical protein